MKKQRGFTLMELLVTITILVILAGLIVGASTFAKRRLATVNELSAARQLMIAYHQYASDHSGKLLEGYKTDQETTGPDGEYLHFPMNARYPWRLMPYLGDPRETLTVNGNRKAWDAADPIYQVSVMPNLGINAVLVGGHYGSASPLPPTKRFIDAYGKFFVSHAHEVQDPTNLIVFASARQSEKEKGYFEVRPPKLTQTLWSSAEFDEDRPAKEHGFVDFRHGGKAVVAKFDGSAELMTEEQMRDMRLWSNQAARRNDADFTIRKINSH